MIDDYARLNSSYRKKLVFRFGDGAGFFSEFNNLVLALLYCLDRKIRFVIYSPPDGSLAISRGWEDYFQPFCEEARENFHKTCNERFLMRRLSLGERAERNSFKRRYGFDYYTYELWPKFKSERFMSKSFDIPELGIKGDARAAAGRLARMLWRYDRIFGVMVAGEIAALDLPANYAGLHIRGGDKTTEARIFSPGEYMTLIADETDCKDVFVLTDDYRYIRELRATYKEYTFYTTCKEAEEGYDFSTLQKLDKKLQYREYAKLIASMDILAGATRVFGSYKTNPGMFLGMMMGNRFRGIDSDSWLWIW